MEAVSGGEIFQILLFMVWQIPFVLAVYGFSKRMTPKSYVPVIITAIPGIGFFYFYWFCYKTVRYLLDKFVDDQ
jgi:hypothetical protein